MSALLDRLAGYSWRLLLVGLVGWAAAWLLWRLRIVVLPLAAASLLTVVLAPPARRLRAHRWPAAAAAWAVMVGFLGALAVAGWLVVPSVVDEFSELGPTLEEAVDDVETWLVEDSPFEVDREDVRRLRGEVGDWVNDTFASSPGVVVDRAVVLAEVVAGIVIALVATFFFVKDGDGIQAWATARLPERHRETARRLGRSARHTLAGYLRGSALLGVVEALIIGTVVAVAGGSLVPAIMVVTFLAAFVPFVGAVVAGVLAVLVTLVSAGLPEAALVAAVALVVQQLDNDVLAPVVFGRALSLHPLVILLSIAGGAALGGAAGAVLAVPLVAVVTNAAGELRRDADADGAGGDRTEGASEEEGSIDTAARDLRPYRGRTPRGPMKA